jgi:hypothetical protein
MHFKIEFHFQHEENATSIEATNAEFKRLGIEWGKTDCQASEVYHRCVQEGLIPEKGSPPYLAIITRYTIILV